MWSEGDVVLRREVLNDGRCWAEFPVVVVRDEPRLLATYIPEGTPFTFHQATGRSKAAVIPGRTVTAGPATAP